MNFTDMLLVTELTDAHVMQLLRIGDSQCSSSHLDKPGADALHGLLDISTRDREEKGCSRQGKHTVLGGRIATTIKIIETD